MQIVLHNISIMEKYSDNALQVAKLSDGRLAYTHHIHVSSHDALRLSATEFVEVHTHDGRTGVYVWRENRNIQKGQIELSMQQRKYLNVSVGEMLQVRPYSVRLEEYAAVVSLEANFARKKTDISRQYDAAQLRELFHANFDNQCLMFGHEMLLDVAGAPLQFTVKDVQRVPVDEDSGKTSNTRGFMLPKTTVIITAAPLCGLKLNATDPSRAVPFAPDFNFEKMGIGGLDRQFTTIFRRAFATRLYPPTVVAALGVRHIKGMLLHGPPGTGKTLIARKIGEMLKTREPKVVNGPEILNKYVGQSESNLRDLFADAEMEYTQKGDESELHLIIFDEIDAICKQRGSSGGGTGIGDSIVNQLLSKLDGVKQINNVLVIGMTNRKDMIDEALLRPGRLELHVEIGLPDKDGRLQILNIHTAQMRESKYLSSDVDLLLLAEQTKNYSGAELTGLIRSATSFALNRTVDPKTHKPDPSKISIMAADFASALAEIQPAFGAPQEQLARSLYNGIIPYSETFAETFAAAKLFIQQALTSTRTPLVSLILAGNAGSGKTAVAAALAQESEFLCVRVLSPENFIGITENTRVAKINQAFEDCYRSKSSLLIIDDLESFIEYVDVGPRFSNAVLQALIVLFRKHPPEGRRLVVIATTARRDLLADLGLASAASAVLTLPPISLGAEAAAVLRALEWEDHDLEKIRDGWTGKIEMKRLILLSERAKQMPGSRAENLLQLIKHT